MKTMRVVMAILAVLLIMPIWYYLLHWMLVKIGAGELQMFLFWVYVPLGLLFAIVRDIATALESKK